MIPGGLLFKIYSPGVGFMSVEIVETVPLLVTFKNLGNMFGSEAGGDPFEYISMSYNF